MKLRNKKTGEIRELQEIMHEAFIQHNEKSLMNLNEDWEDYEEPKVIYYISWDGMVLNSADRTGWQNAKQIGNYFETKEEAEKAVEKLKAWKRLKDKGFKFECAGEYERLCGNGFEIPITATMPPEAYLDPEVTKDLDLLFGGEE